MKFYILDCETSKRILSLLKEDNIYSIDRISILEDDDKLYVIIFYFYSTNRVIKIDKGFNMANKILNTLKY